MTFEAIISLKSCLGFISQLRRISFAQGFLASCFFACVFWVASQSAWYTRLIASQKLSRDNTILTEMVAMLIFRKLYLPLRL